MAFITIPMTVDTVRAEVLRVLNSNSILDKFTLLTIRGAPEVIEADLVSTESLLNSNPEDQLTAYLVKVFKGELVMYRNTNVMFTNINSHEDGKSTSIEFKTYAGKPRTLERMYTKDIVNIASISRLGGACCSDCVEARYNEDLANYLKHLIVINPEVE
ncbi:hypothetical protein [Carp edema virus]|nr:hypothetical protein [Carp edema virus]